MVLNDKRIKELVNEGRLSITPFIENNVQPASVDVTLSDSFSIILPEPQEKNKKRIMDITNPIAYKEIKTDEFILYPNKFVLASTIETIKLPNDILVKVEGRSSVGRLGIFIQTAGVIDPGFHGQITLEIFNAGANAVRFIKGMRIGQLIFHQLSEPSENSYNGKYQHQMGATSSQIFKDKELIQHREDKEGNGSTV